MAPFRSLRGTEKLRNFVNKDMDRIKGITIHRPLTPDLHKRFSLATLKSTATWTELLTTQSDAISTYMRVGGLFGIIGVGWGKTAISLSCAHQAYQKGLRKMLLLLPANIAPQLVQKDIQMLVEQIPMDYPINVISGQSKKTRLKRSQRDSGLFIVSYSQLSTQDTDEIIENIAPDIIIADEAHNLSNRASARTRRVERWMNAFPETEFVALSGTMSKKTLKDMYHILKWCLKDQAPLPSTWSETSTWAAVLDTTFAEFTSDTTLYPLLEWARKHWPDEQWTRDIPGYRRAYKRRLDTTLGVVATGDKQIATSLLIENKPVPYENVEGWDEIKELMEDVEDMVSPSGDELEHAIHKAQYNDTLTSGFYNRLVWPEPDQLADRAGLSVSDATEYLLRAKEHHKAHQVYSANLRRWLKDYACPGMDTPMAIGLNMYHHGARDVGQSLFDDWDYMKKLEFENMPERDSYPVFICPFKVRAAIAWAKQQKGGSIIWYYHRAMGTWLFETAKEEGLNPVFCYSGDVGNQRIINEQNRGRLLIASIHGHGTGKNLQSFQNNYLCQFPRSAGVFEQLLGRSHRTGQTADQLVYNMNISLPYEEQKLSATLADALFIHQTEGRQKLIYSNYNPVPKIIPSTVLREQGLITKSIDQSIEKSLITKFTGTTL